MADSLIPQSETLPGVNPVTPAQTLGTTQQAAGVTTPSAPATSPPPASLIPTAEPSAPAVSGMSTVGVTGQPVVAGLNASETASGQLKTLLDEQSPLLQSARTRAQEFATSRGLQNSTMAAQSGEKALIDSALPIAQFDATANFNRTNANLGAINQFGLQEAGIQGQLRVGDQSYQNQSSLLSQETAARVQLLTQEGQQRLQEISAQTDASARLQQMDQDFRLLQQDRAAGYDLQLEDRRFQNSQALMIAEYGQRLGLSQAEQLQQIERMNLQHAQTLEQIAAQAEAAQKADVGPRLQSQYLASVTDRMTAASNEIATIYQTEGLNASQQSTAVANARNRLQTDLDAIAAYYRQSPFWDEDWGKTPAPSGPLQPSGGSGNGVPDITPGGGVPPSSIPGTSPIAGGGSRGRTNVVLNQF